MAFLIYKKTAAGTTLRYERIRPLKLGGRDGAIARHVKSLSVEQGASWRLDAAALLKLCLIDGGKCSLDDKVVSNGERQST